MLPSGGQSMRSVNVADSDTIQASHLDLVFKDIQPSVNVHQVGSVNAALDVPLAGNTAAADTSQAYNQSTGAKTAVSGGAAMGHNDYISAVTTISNYNHTHLELSILLVTFPRPSAARSSVRTTTWGTGSVAQPTAIYHIVTVAFASATAKKLFF